MAAKAPVNVQLPSLLTATDVPYWASSLVQALVALFNQVSTRANLGLPTDSTEAIGTFTFATLPTAVSGALANVSDSNTNVWGANVAGGGANNVLARYNGANWTVVGK